ncbi:flagellar hook-length control protein FliK [Paenibacillus sp. TAB 01]|uniref:flagellar hook-length control protein FliK n=1 Tax=Paenibacillus sp. TAB 01 TaxID=3368988 RepID=UPI0037510350
MLVQLLTELSSQEEASGIPASEDISKQLDALIEKLGSDDEGAKKLLDDPDVQAWLAQIQLLLAVQPAANTAAADASAETAAKTDDSVQLITAPAANISDNRSQTIALDPLLFVPLETAGGQDAAVQQTQAVSLKPVTKEEAVELLAQFKKTLEKEPSSPAVQSIQRSLASLLASPQQPVQQQVLNAEIPLPVTAAVPAVPQALELLAAKVLSPRLESKTEASDEPLFEPLADVQASDHENPTMPIQEYIKQASTAAHTAKTPVLVANAPTFAEDMTQFVVKSFSMNVLAEGVTEAKLSLYPQHLGQVDVKLTMHNGQLIAQFMADSTAGKEMLEGQLTQLRTNLQSQGIHVEKLEVSQNQAFQSGLFQEQRQQQQSQQSSKQSKGNGANQAVSMEEELAQAASASAQAQQASNNGVRRTSIDTTA